MESINGIILIDKPSDWTSMDVCSKLRGILHERRIGHSGTLDPMATGLLVVFVGKATKAVEFAEADKKRYLAGIQLGISTDTQDTTGEILQSREREVTQEEFDATLDCFRGEIDQIPPMYSAIKIDGQRLYKMARQGRQVDRPARHITIHALERTSPIADCSTMLDVTCSKGTYIRTLCHDIGEYLGTGAAMSSLRRTEAGAFSVEKAYSLEDVAQIAADGRINDILLPVHSLFANMEKFVTSTWQERKVRTGCAFEARADDGQYTVFAENGDFLMLGICENGEMRSVKNFF